MLQIEVTETIHQKKQQNDEEIKNHGSRFFYRKWSMRGLRYDGK